MGNHEHKKKGQHKFRTVVSEASYLVGNLVVNCDCPPFLIIVIIMNIKNSEDLIANTGNFQGDLC